MPRIQDILQKNGILIDLKGPTKQELLAQMARYMASVYDLKFPETIVARILERETATSTGIGFGIAIPHARIDGLSRLYMIAGRAIDGIEFNAIDEGPVNLLFMMVSPTNTSTEHTTVLSILSRILSYEEIRKDLLGAPDIDTFLSVLVAGENKYVS